MARWTIYTLILLNLVAFLWFYNRTPAESSKQTAEIPLLFNSDRIKLLPPEVKIDDSQIEVDKDLPSEKVVVENTNETVVEGEQRLVEPPLENEQVLEPLEQSLPPAEQVAVKQQQKTINKPPLDKPPIVESPSDKEGTAQPIATSSTAKEIIPVSDKALSTEEQKLIAEMTSFSEEGEQQSPETTLPELQLDMVSDESSPSLEKVCYQYDPLNQKQAEVFSQFFRQQDIPFVQQSRKQTQAAGFLVLIHPSASVAEARQQIQEVKAVGLDAFIIGKGEWRHGISLGIFSNRNNANSRLQKAQELLPESSIEVKQRFKDVSVFRLIFALEQGENPDELLSTSSFPSIDTKKPPKVTKKSCKSVEF